MRIKDTLLSKEHVFNSNDVFEVSDYIKHSASEFGKVFIRKDKYETNGPRKRVHLVFDIAKKIDSVSHLMVSVETNGVSSLKRGTMSVKITVSLDTNIREYGIFSSVFEEQYLERYLRETKDSAEKEASKILSAIEEQIDTLKIHA